jgi:hypothetical protein
LEAPANFGDSTPGPPAYFGVFLHRVAAHALLIDAPADAGHFRRDE